MLKPCAENFRSWPRASTGLGRRLPVRARLELVGWKPTGRPRAARIVLDAPGQGGRLGGLGDEDTEARHGWGAVERLVCSFRPWRWPKASPRWTNGCWSACGLEKDEMLKLFNSLTGHAEPFRSAGA